MPRFENFIANYTFSDRIFKMLVAAPYSRSKATMLRMIREAALL